MQFEVATSTALVCAKQLAADQKVTNQSTTRTTELKTHITVNNYQQYHTVFVHAPTLHTATKVKPQNNGGAQTYKHTHKQANKQTNKQTAKNIIQQQNNKTNEQHAANNERDDRATNERVRAEAREGQ